MADVLTVRAALELEVFQRTEVQVLAGEDLDRPVRWVHTGEIADIHRFLLGDEMLLTAGLGMGKTPDLQRAFIRRLADARAAVLVVELAGRMFESMPEAAVEEARAVGLPLVGLRDEIPFVEASAQIHEVLVDLRVSQLVEEEANSQVFIDLLAHEDYVGLVNVFARRAGYPVVLENAAHQMLAYAGATPEADKVVETWSAHSRALHERHRRPVRDTSSTSSTKEDLPRDIANCTRSPIVLRGESWGWLHLLHNGADPTSADLRNLERAAAAIAITLLGEREIGARTAQRQGALLNRLQLGDLSGEKFVGRALTLGQDLRHRDLIVVVTGRDANGEPFTNKHLAFLLHDAGWPAVVGDIGDFDLAIAGLPPGVGDRELLATLAKRGVWGGLSRVVAPAALPTALRQARSAASAAAAGRANQLLRFDDLGALRLLVALADGPELSRYIEDELGPLLEHDVLASHPLLPTLRAFLECGGNKARAAEVLFVQRRTLYHRLDRLSAILGLDLADIETQQRLQLALRGHDLLRRPASRRG
ncbi:PucR family transcriptional regulator [Saccharopolyspora sp. NPDC000995]